MALDIAHQRFHTGDDQAAFAGACDLASPAQSVFQVTLGAHIDPLLSWHEKNLSTVFLYGNGGRKLRENIVNMEIFIDAGLEHLG